MARLYQPDRHTSVTCKRHGGLEAAATFGWHKYVGLDGAVIGLDHFGASAPYKFLFKEYGFTAENVAATAKKVLG